MLSSFWGYTVIHSIVTSVFSKLVNIRSSQRIDLLSPYQAHKGFLGYKCVPLLSNVTVTSSSLVIHQLSNMMWAGFFPLSG